MNNHSSPYLGTYVLSRSVYERTAAAHWASRRAPQAANDTGWQILGAADTSEYLAVPGNLLIVDGQQACAIVPAMVGVWNYPVGSVLTLSGAGQPAMPKRRNGRFATGLALLILGILFLLGRFSSTVRGTSYVPQSPAAAAGALTADVLMIVAPLIVGIVLLATSKRRP